MIVLEIATARLTAVPVGLAVIVAVAAGCGGGGPSDAELIDRLPQLVPQAEDLQRLIPKFPAEHFVLMETQSNASQRRYAVWYHIGPPEAGAKCCVDVSASIRVFEDDGAAQRFLELGPRETTRGEFPVADLGDAALAWPRSRVNGQPDCPCDLRFRVGRVAAYVRVSYGGPPMIHEGVGAMQLALAELTAARMREALD